MGVRIVTVGIVDRNVCAHSLGYKIALDKLCEQSDTLVFIQFNGHAAMNSRAMRLSLAFSASSRRRSIKRFGLSTRRERFREEKPAPGQAPACGCNHAERRRNHSRFLSSSYMPKLRLPSGLYLG